MAKKKNTPSVDNNSSYEGLFSELKQLIDDSRQRIAVSVNSELTGLYWKIGHHINTHILENKKPGYGDQVIANLSESLTNEFGSGWSKKQLWNCLRTAETFPDGEKMNALRSQLSWTHIRTLIYINDELKREFYMRMCIQEGWSTRQLRERIDSMLFERTAISKKPEKQIKKELEKLAPQEPMSPDLVFRDPYVLDFLGLKDTYSERDLENAILAELQSFILEVGTDFAFLARQKRISIDGEDFYIDLLFYHRKLRRLVAIDLKLGKFKAAYKGQMELYLRWLAKNEMTEGEESPIGLILCAEKSGEQIELLQLDKGNIRVAEYLTALPSREWLKKKLHYAIEYAKQKYTDEKKNKD